jgi:hypothetical protein
MTLPTPQVQEVRDPKGLMTFIRVPWQIYKGNPYWVPPLIKDQLSKLDSRHPFRSHADMVFFLATRGETMVGRIAGIIDHHYIGFQQERAGFFGFFESIDDPGVAKALLSRVADWLKANGMVKMIGPMNPSTNDECALLIDGFNSSPSLMMPYNPPCYPSLVEGYGLKKAMDLYAYWLDASAFDFERLDRITRRIQKREPRLYVRSLNLRRFEEELGIIKDIYNNAWSKNWGFVPLTDDEIDLMARDLKPLVVPELVLLAYLGEAPVAFSVGLPDYNLVLKRLNGKLGLPGLLKFFYYRRKIHSARVMLLGVKLAFQRKGIESLLYVESFKKGVRKGYYSAECSWILETNPLMQRGIEAMGGKRYKTYLLYEMDL